MSDHGRFRGSTGAALTPTPVIAAVLLSLLCLLVLLLAWPSPSGATFPGKDGRILVSSNSDGSYDIYSMKPDGTGARQLTNNGYYNDDATLSPNGKKIAYKESFGGGLA